MTVLVCLDEKDGMAFDGRRQTRDSAVIKDIFATAKGAPIKVAPYSEKLLSEYGRVKVTREPLMDKDEDAFVFLEVDGIGEYASRIDTLIIYRWSEVYPSDLKFLPSPSALGLTLLTKSYIVGSSHKKITKEVYTK